MSHLQVETQVNSSFQTDGTAQYRGARRKKKPPIR
jgi:hypothetical protein